MNLIIPSKIYFFEGGFPKNTANIDYTYEYQRDNVLYFNFYRIAPSIGMKKKMRCR